MELTMKARIHDKVDNRETPTASERLGWALKPHRSSLGAQVRVRDPFEDRNRPDKTLTTAPKPQNHQ